jgi:hypothetical protein
MKGNWMVYIVSPPMTLLCRQVPSFGEIKHADWIHIVTLTGKHVFLQKRNVAMLEEVPQEKIDKAKADAEARMKGSKIVMPEKTIPGMRH